MHIFVSFCFSRTLVPDPECCQSEIERRTDQLKGKKILRLWEFINGNSGGRLRTPASKTKRPFFQLQDFCKKFKSQMCQHGRGGNGVGCTGLLLREKKGSSYFQTSSSVANPKGHHHHHIWNPVTKNTLGLSQWLATMYHQRVRTVVKVRVAVQWYQLSSGLSVTFSPDCTPSSSHPPPVSLVSFSTITWWCFQFATDTFSWHV